MAQALGIKRGWFHTNHYDIPKYLLEYVQTEAIEARPRQIVNIIKTGKL